MRLIQVAVLSAAVFFSSGVSASPEHPQPGKEYVLLKNRQSVPDSAKTEVVEFFMYHCPACNFFEPALANWVKTREDAILFRRVHLPHNPENDPEARLFLTLDALQMENALHDKVMHTWHVERRRLASDADNIAWAAANGIDTQKFKSVYESFSINTKLRSLPRYVEAYGVDSTPTIVIDGRYLTNPSMVRAANPGIADQNLGAAWLTVVDTLVARAKKEK